MRIAYLGPEGTFSEEAALAQAARDGAELIPFASFPALVAAVETGMAERAILPIENSLEGSVSGTVDLLIHDTDLKLCGELVLPVRHFLIVVPGTELRDIRTVTSHPQALGQCRRFIERCLPGTEQVAALSTAAAVAEVMAAGDRARAAIGTRRAAELYGAEILAHDIQDLHNNVTRFVVLAREDVPPTGRDKTSLCFSVKANVPGALYEVLGVLAAARIQMTKVESRPKKSKLGDYYFLVDIEGHRQDPHIAAALEQMAGVVAELKVFGSYPASPVPATARPLAGA
ncbi:MAG: prephenate dehydratase [Sphaerobacter sp.]|nr:prephenate dehydratase [Sphaerobacter sp.]